MSAPGFWKLENQIYLICYQPPEPLAALAGGMAEPFPIDPDPVVPDVPDEPMDGLVEEVPGVLVVEVSDVLLQPERASAATRASAAAVPVFSLDAYISVSFEKEERLTDCQPVVNLAARLLIET
jgi:hypothetical protein